MNPFIDAATTMFDSMSFRPKTDLQTWMAAGRDQLAEAGRKMVAGYEEAAAMGQANMDAVIEAGDALAKGAGAVGQAVGTLTQSAIEQSMAAGQSVLAARTPDAMVTAHAALVKVNLENTYAGMVKLADVSTAASKAALAPLAARAGAVMEQINQPLMAQAR